MWLTIGQLLLIAYVPGALLFRLPFADRELRASLPAEERVFWAVILSVLTTSLAALALAAAGQYAFHRLLIVDALVSFVVLTVANRRLPLPTSAPRVTWTALVPLAIIALGAYLYVPTAEYVIGGKDPGTYINEGIQIAQRGSLTIVDPLVAAVPAASRDLFFPSHDNSTYYGTRFMGFFILDPDAGTVSGQFPHLFPVWIAIGYGLHGLTGARETIAWWSLLALVAVYMTGRPRCRDRGGGRRHDAAGPQRGVHLVRALSERRVAHGGPDAGWAAGVHARTYGRGSILRAGRRTVAAADVVLAIRRCPRADGGLGHPPAGDTLRALVRLVVRRLCGGRTWNRRHVFDDDARAIHGAAIHLPDQSEGVAHRQPAHRRDEHRGYCRLRATPPGAR